MRAGDVAARIRALTGGRGVDYAFENAGVVETFNAAIDCLARRGTCAIATIPHLGEPFEWSPLNLLLRAGRLVVCIEGDSVPDLFIPKLAELQIAGRLPYERFCRQYAFADFAGAWDDAEQARAVKPILRMS
jgi:aryl-alcohol dehydrogenase